MPPSLAIHRTGTTSLSHEELLVLDEMFDSYVSEYVLGQLFTRIAEKNNSKDDKLRSVLARLISCGLIELQESSDEKYFSMTNKGGELWTMERCPIWDRYCIERYAGSVQSRTIMSVRAVSEEIRDDFLRLWPLQPTRTRTYTFTDDGLIYWLNFKRVYVGVVSYASTWCESSHDFDAFKRQHFNAVEAGRTWWRNLGELQKFLEKSSN
jgi:hypothetical protein